MTKVLGFLLIVVLAAAGGGGFFFHKKHADAEGALNAQVADLETKMETLQAERDQAKADQQKGADLLVTFQKGKQDLTKELEATTAKAEAADKAAETAQAELKTASSELAALKEAHEALTGAHAAQTKELADVKSTMDGKIAAAEKTAAEKTAEVEATREKLTKSLAAYYAKQQQDLGARMKAAEERADKAEKALQTTIAEKDALKAKVVDAIPEKLLKKYLPELVPAAEEAPAE